MKTLAYISLCVMISSCASKQMKASIASLEKQNKTLRGDVTRLQEKVNSLTNDLLVVQTRVENHSVPSASSAPTSAPAIVTSTMTPVTSKTITAMTLQNSVFGDDIKFSDDEPSLKFTNKDLNNAVQQTPPAQKSAPTSSPATKTKGNLTDTTTPSPSQGNVAPATVAVSPPPGSNQTGVEDPAIVAAYNKAYKKFKEQNYKETIELMTDFLKKYPAHPYSDNAIFWIAESYFQLKNYERAEQEFERVIQQYPNGNKVPDALLRSGICKLRMSEPQKAKVSFDQLIAKYPESMAAKRAKATLGEI